MAPPPGTHKPVTVRKVLVRDIEVPIHQSAARIVRNLPKRAPEPIHKSDNERYRNPCLRTTQELADQMQRVRMAPIPGSRTVKDLTPKAQEFVQEKAAQKLNFPATKSVFKQLQPINVNDSVLELECHTSRPRRKTFTRPDRDPEPVLADYLRPIALLSSRTVLDDFGCEQVQLDRAPSSDNYVNVCRLLDMLECDE